MNEVAKEKQKPDVTYTLNIQWSLDLALGDEWLAPFLDERFRHRATAAMQAAIRKEIQETGRRVKVGYLSTTKGEKMENLITMCILLVALTISCFAAPDFNPFETPGCQGGEVTITGTVTDSTTGAELPMCKVRLINANRKVTCQTVSTPRTNGVYTFPIPVLESNFYWINAQAENHFMREDLVFIYTVGAPYTYTYNVSLNAWTGDVP